MSIAALKTPVPLANDGDHVPPKLGAPFKTENKFIGSSFLQTVFVASFPASKVTTINTVTFAESGVHVALPDTV